MRCSTGCARRSSIPTNVDVPAFHEGFSDLVALFLHFTYADVVEQAIRESRGTHHARVAADRHRPGVRLRAIADRAAPTRCARASTSTAWRRSIPTSLPGQGRAARASTIRSSSRTRSGRCWCRRCSRRSRPSCGARRERFYRIAGLDPQALDRAPLNDALVKAIAQEASDVAGQFLNICIRAIDYCPPADMELGEYLRAIITADGDLERSDKWGFREALMRSFRRRRDLSRPRAVHDRGRRALAAAGRRRCTSRAWPSANSKFDGDPGQPASAEELLRQAHALGRFVTNPKHAECFRLVAPGSAAAEGRRPGVAAARAVDPRHAARRARRPGRLRPGRRGHAVLHRRPQGRRCST